MAIFRARSGSREGGDPYAVRTSFSKDPNDSLEESLIRVESGELSSGSGTVKNRSPISHRLSTIMSTTDTNLPVFPSVNNNNNNNNTNSGNGSCSSNSNNSNNNNSPAWYTPLLTSLRHNPDAVYIGIALVAWYLVGVLAICTTKILLSTPLEEGGVPAPLLFTFQQMCLGSSFLRVFLLIKGRITGAGIQPWPVERESETPPKSTSWWKPAMMVDFLLLSGLFNGLDFLASNTSFSHSSATFVETIKASEPITTTGLAVWWGIDRLGKRETLALTVLITGVLISTYANATANDHVAAEAPSLQESFKTCLTVMTANLCFAFRALAQKMLRSSASGCAQNLDDFNLLFRMQQTGAASLLLPVLLFERHKLLQVLFGRESWHVMGYYVGLSLVNAWAFATYTLASCFVLTRISVVQHSGFGCLRRLFVVVATSIAFGVPIHALGGMGILMSVVGFGGFTHYRFQRQGQGKKERREDVPHDDGNHYSLLNGSGDAFLGSSSEEGPC